MDYFETDVDRSTCLHGHHQVGKVERFDVSNVIYHRFSHGAVSYTFNGENVNIMLELSIFLHENIFCDPSLEQSH